VRVEYIFLLNKINSLNKIKLIFQTLYDQLLNFCKENVIDISRKPRPRRQKQVPARFNDSIVISTVGNQNYIDNKEQYRTTIYYPLIDSVLIELNHRFSRETIEILTSVSSLSPNNENFLNFEKLKTFALHLDIDLDLLLNELNVLQPMMRKKDLSNIIELYWELMAYQDALPNVILLVQGAMTIPVTSVTCERSFSKMKTIKTALKNTMNDLRFSDLCVLAVQRDFQIDFDDVIEVFATNHKNARIMLK
jgi:hypothetical protein